MGAAGIGGAGGFTIDRGDGLGSSSMGGTIGGMDGATPPAMKQSPAKRIKRQAWSKQKLDRLLRASESTWVGWREALSSNATVMPLMTRALEMAGK